MIYGNRVKGKVAIITGSALGIGQACAKLLAAEGAAVAVTDVNDEAGQCLVDEICEAGGTAGFWHLDVSNEREVTAVTQMVRTKFGPTTILVNNAGVGGTEKPTHEVTADEWDNLMAINAKGVFLCTKHVLPQMMSVKRGSIVNLSAIYGLVGASQMAPFRASKGAVQWLTKTDAITYARYGIRVNTIHPGFISTPMTENHLAARGDDSEDTKIAAQRLHPMGRMGDPEDVAFGVLYLASDESRFVSGAELVIDGGFSARLC
ncbi:MAG: glucose 1-dehydrogenase [Fimbriimonas sp.]|nr:glucose 1-dehydrogenase [Fimbriimonas sp.]